MRQNVSLPDSRHGRGDLALDCPCAFAPVAVLRGTKDAWKTSAPPASFFRLMACWQCTPPWRCDLECQCKLAASLEPKSYAKERSYARCRPHPGMASLVLPPEFTNIVLYEGALAQESTRRRTRPATAPPQNWDAPLTRPALLLRGSDPLPAGPLHLRRWRAQQHFVTSWSGGPRRFVLRPSWGFSPTLGELANSVPRIRLAHYLIVASPEEPR